MDDLGEACVFALECWSALPVMLPGMIRKPLSFLNVGTGVDLPIKDLAEMVATAAGYEGLIQWDATLMAPQNSWMSAGCRGWVGPLKSL